MLWRRNGKPVASVEGKTDQAVHSQCYANSTPPQKAIANLRAFASPQTNWYKCPLTRRAAVLILLFADLKGDLRVVLTIRSAGLKNCTFDPAPRTTRSTSLPRDARGRYRATRTSHTDVATPDAGQAALPGGKADTLSESPFTIARREAHEEIGLPTTSSALPPGYTLEHLTELPANLAMTELGVRPCVAYLRTPQPSPANKNPDASRDILPKLDRREVAAVFTAPFYNFLREKDLDPAEGKRVGGEWYKGSWHSWHESAWRMHQFFVPVSPETVFLADKQKRREDTPTAGSGSESGGKQDPSAAAKPTGKSSSRSSSSLKPPLPRSFYSTSNDALAQPRYRVFGMTARILVDCARVAYGEEPEYEHNSHFGDEEMIDRLLKIGRLGEKRREGEVLTREVMMEAAKAKI